MFAILDVIVYIPIFLQKVTFVYSTNSMHQKLETILSSNSHVVYNSYQFPL